jgi:hypothetical protein
MFFFFRENKNDMSHVLPYVSMGVLSAVIAYFAISSPSSSASNSGYDSKKKTYHTHRVKFGKRTRYDDDSDNSNSSSDSDSSDSSDDDNDDKYKRKSRSLFSKSNQIALRLSGLSHSRSSRSPSERMGIIFYEKDSKRFILCKKMGHLTMFGETSDDSVLRMYEKVQRDTGNYIRFKNDFSMRNISSVKRNGLRIYILCLRAFDRSKASIEKISASKEGIETLKRDSTLTTILREVIHRKSRICDDVEYRVVQKDHYRLFTKA